MSAPVFTIYLLMLTFDNPPLFFGMGANGPLVFHSLAACEVERVAAAKRNYPDAFCVRISTSKGDAQ